jgi:hypothetical protein
MTKFLRKFKGCDALNAKAAARDALARKQEAAQPRPVAIVVTDSKGRASRVLLERDPMGGPQYF